MGKKPLKRQGARSADEYLERQVKFRNSTIDTKQWYRALAISIS
jgi:hypothetical protein